MPMERAERDIRILLIDDEAAVLDVTKSILEWIGYRVTATSSSVKALSLFGEDPNRYDLAITDMHLPVLMGDKLARQIRKIRLDVPVILFSGDTGQLTRQRALETGIREFVRKPSKMEDLTRVVHKVLEGDSPQARRGSGCQLPG